MLIFVLGFCYVLNKLFNYTAYKLSLIPRPWGHKWRYEQDSLVTAVQPRSCICSSDHYACCGSLIVQPRDNVIHRNIIIAAQIRFPLSLHLRRTTSHSNRKRLRRKWSIQNLVANYRTLTRTIGQLFVIFLCIWAYCFAGFTTKF